MSSLDAAHKLLVQQLMTKICHGSGLTFCDNNLEEPLSATTSTATTSTAPAPGPSQTPQAPAAKKKKKRVLVLDDDHELQDVPVVHRTAVPGTVVSDSDDEPSAATTTKTTARPKAKETAEAKKARRLVDEAERKRKKDDKHLADAATEDEQQRTKAVEDQRRQREESGSLCAQALGIYDAMHPLGHAPTPAERQTIRAKVTARRDECIEGVLMHAFRKAKGEVEGPAPMSKLDERVNQFLNDTKVVHVPTSAISKRVLALKRASTVPGVIRILRQREVLNQPTWLPPRFHRDEHTGKACYRTSDGIQQKQGEQRAFWTEAMSTKENRLETVRAELKQLALAREQQTAAR